MSRSLNTVVAFAMARHMASGAPSGDIATLGLELNAEQASRAADSYAAKLDRAA